LSNETVSQKNYILDLEVNKNILKEIELDELDGKFVTNIGIRLTREKKSDLS